MTKTMENIIILTDTLFGKNMVIRWNEVVLQLVADSTIINLTIKETSELEHIL